MKLDPRKFFLIAGPCVAESKKVCFETARALAALRDELGIQVIFKASYLKANRSSGTSYRGPGLDRGLKLLDSVKNKFELPVLTDVHETIEIDAVSRVADVLQIPAFLCRQTRLLEKAAATRLWINIKKGQFLAPWDLPPLVEKIPESRRRRVLITERGTSFGYNNLVVDLRGMAFLLRRGFSVVFDATHSVQLPAACGGSSGGDRSMAEPLARAAASIGVTGFFFEIHPDPDRALCDGPNSLPLDDFPATVRRLLRLSGFARSLDASPPNPGTV